MILVIIPISKSTYYYGFSAPLQWILTDIYKEYEVQAIYSDNEFIDDFIRKADFFIVELNWFLQLYEFIELIKHIRTISNRAIMFGGLFSNQFYKSIFSSSEVDYFIKGDNEKSIKPLIEKHFNHESKENIFNLIDRNKENSKTWTFTSDDFFNLKYSLEWFPEYKLRLRYKNGFGVDKDGFNYAMPLFLTAKTGCGCKIKTDLACKGCLGSTTFSKDYYKRNTINMKAKHLNHIIDTYENFNEYNSISLFDFSSSFDYENLNFINKGVNLEVDSSLSVEKMKLIESKFKKINYVFIGAGDYNETKNDFDQNEVRKLLEYIETRDYKEKVIYYHNHYHNGDETKVEKDFEGRFFHSKNWVTSYSDYNEDSHYENYNDFFNKENFNNILIASKKNFDHFRTKEKLIWIK